jgi:hypothetical protein
MKSTSLLLASLLSSTACTNNGRSSPADARLGFPPDVSMLPDADHTSVPDAAHPPSADAGPLPMTIDPMTMKFASGFYDISSIATNTNAVYVADYTAIHRVLRDGTNGGTPATAYTVRILVDDTTLWWNDSSNYAYSTAADGTGTTMPFLGGAIAGLTGQDALAIYLDGSWMGRAPKDGSMVTTLGPGSYAGSAVDDTSNSIYFFQEEDPTSGSSPIDLYSASKLDGTGKQTIVVNATDYMGQTQILADATHIYWYGSGMFRRITKATPHVTESVPSPASYFTPIVQDDTNLYYIDGTPGGTGATIWVVNKTGLVAHPYATIDRGLGALAVDRTGIYVAVFENRPQWEMADWVARLPLP